MAIAPATSGTMEMLLSEAQAFYASFGTELALLLCFCAGFLLFQSDAIVSRLTNALSAVCGKPTSGGKHGSGKHANGACGDANGSSAERAGNAAGDARLFKELEADFYGGQYQAVLSNWSRMSYRSPELHSLVLQSLVEADHSDREVAAHLELALAELAPALPRGPVGAQLLDAVADAGKPGLAHQLRRQLRLREGVDASKGWTNEGDHAMSGGSSGSSTEWTESATSSSSSGSDRSTESCSSTDDDTATSVRAKTKKHEILPTISSPQPAALKPLAPLRLPSRPAMATRKPEQTEEGAGVSYSLAFLCRVGVAMSGSDMEATLNLHTAACSEGLAPLPAIKLRPRGTTASGKDRTGRSSQRKEEGAWRRDGSKREHRGGGCKGVMRPTGPHTALPAPSATSWAVKQREVAEPTAQVCRQLRSLLNKLTTDKFDKLYPELIAILTEGGAGAVDVLVRLVFEKATTQHHFLPMYTKLCLDVAAWHKEQNASEAVAESVEGDGACREAGKQDDFRRILLTECQAAFERHLEPFQKPESMTDVDEIFEAEVKHKVNVLGTVKFVGHLLAQRMLAGTLLFHVTDKLLEGLCPDRLESLCAFLHQVGPHLASHKAWAQTSQLQALFTLLEGQTNSDQQPPRTVCLLKDVLDMRSQWSIGGGQPALFRSRSAVKAQLPTRSSVLTRASTSVARAIPVSPPASNASSPRPVKAAKKEEDEPARRPIASSGEFRWQLNEALQVLLGRNQPKSTVDAAVAKLTSGGPPELRGSALQVGEFASLMSQLLDEPNHLRPSLFAFAARLLQLQVFGPPANAMEHLVNGELQSLQEEMPDAAPVLLTELLPLVAPLLSKEKHSRLETTLTRC